MYLSIGLIFILSSTLLVHMVLYATEYTWVSKHSKDTLLATGVRFKTYVYLIYFNN